MRYINFEGDDPILTDQLFMKEAIKEATIAYEADEVPIGAIIVCNNRIVARAHNLSETLNDVTAHAEMQAYTAAANFIGGKYLKQCTLYVTVEPCVMCAGASYWAQIDRIVYGTRDEKRGYSIFDNHIIHPKTVIVGGILERECADLMQRFFQQKRSKI